MCKYQERRRTWSRAFYALLLIGCLLLTGCAAPSEEQTQTQPPKAATATEAPAATQAIPADETEPDASGDASLVAFRQALVGTPQQFAAAYFGYAAPDGNMPADPYAVMADAAPQLCENLPFLLQIPEERVIGTDGNLFCIVPTDETASVAVNWYPKDETGESYAEAAVLYRSEAGDPFLLMTTNTFWRMETEVVITDSQGEVTVWYPIIDDDGRIAPMCNGSGASLFCDFSPYDRLYRETPIGGAYMDMAGEWELAWTEVEGDRVPSAPGRCIVEISVYDMEFYRISYTDRDFPKENFTGRELLISPGELYPDCGNNQWIAEVTAPSDERVRHTVTLLADGTLLMQHSWEMDGQPWVSYAGFRRIS